MKPRRLHYRLMLAGRASAPICNSKARGGSRSASHRTTIYRMNVDCERCIRVARIQR